jgi:hypothetical protein
MAAQLSGWWTALSKQAGFNSGDDYNTIKNMVNFTNGWKV